MSLPFMSWMPCVCASALASLVKSEVVTKSFKFAWWWTWAIPMNFWISGEPIFLSLAC